MNQRLAEKYARMAREELRWEVFGAAEADVALVAYGSAARVCQTAVTLLAQRGISANLFRPIPFPFSLPSRWRNLPKGRSCCWWWR